MLSPCCILRVGPLEADAEKESAADPQGDFWGSTSNKRGGVEAGWAEEIELQCRLSKALANPSGNLVVVRVSFPS